MVGCAFGIADGDAAWLVARLLERLRLGSSHSMVVPGTKNGHE
jgi:hypothetical protein